MSNNRHDNHMEIARQELTHAAYKWLNILDELDHDDMADVLKEIVEELESDNG
jgi:hypothetical protein